MLLDGEVVSTDVGLNDIVGAAEGVTVGAAVGVTVGCVGVAVGKRLDADELVRAMFEYTSSITTHPF
jgi:hypothetical protein